MLYLILLPTYSSFAPIGAAVSWGVSAGITGTYYVNQGVACLPGYNSLKEVSIDPYIAIRNAYLQNYDHGIAKVLKQDLPKQVITLSITIKQYLAYLVLIARML